MIQGCPLELRLPDGSRRLTSLVTYGSSVHRAEDGSFYSNEDPRDAEIRVTLPGALSSSDVPPGTEIWLPDEHDA